MATQINDSNEKISITNFINYEKYILHTLNNSLFKIHYKAVIKILCNFKHHNNFQNNKFKIQNFCEIQSKQQPFEALLNTVSFCLIFKNFAIIHSWISLFHVFYCTNFEILTLHLMLIDQLLQITLLLCLKNPKFFSNFFLFLVIFRSFFKSLF